MNCIQLGVIGIGNMGTEHCKNLLAGKVPDIKLVAVADRRSARRDWAKANMPADTLIVEEGKELIHSGVCDAVLIAVPHYQHVELTCEALAAGLHVMCEKPAGVYTKEVRRMNEAANHSQRTFALMFNQRTNCVYRKVKELLDSGAMGELKRVNWIITDWYRSQLYYDSGAWRATWNGEGGGVLLNQCPHQLDLLQWLCGMPVRVQAHCHQGKWHDIEVEDDVTAYLEYANGATGVFVTTTGDLPGTNRLEVTTTRGKLVCENDKLTRWLLPVDEREYCKTSTDCFAKPPCTVEEVQTDGLNEQHVGVLKAFAGHILRGEPLVANGVEGIRGLTLSNAMHLSAWTEKTVELPIDEELFLRLLNERRATSRAKQGLDLTFSTDHSYGGATTKE
ncbi:MAG: Gfo/Idh/MocA family oxidoreductase [Clostridia bacterium]